MCFEFQEDLYGRRALPQLILGKLRLPNPQYPRELGLPEIEAPNLADAATDRLEIDGHFLRNSQARSVLTFTHLSGILFL